MIEKKKHSMDVLDMITLELSLATVLMFYKPIIKKVIFKI